MEDNDGTGRLGEGMRRIEAMPISGITPGPVGAVRPAFKWVDPATLLVEDKYQRNLSDKSTTLIRRIVMGWDWSRMKPPICAENEDGDLVVVDGQHTAIAACSHPGIDTIPVMIVSAASVKDRAAAFMGHNRDRVNVTSVQLYYASIAAGDPVALAAEEACKRAGVRVMRYVPKTEGWKVGETVSIKNILRIAERKGTPGAHRLLRMLVAAERAPISTIEIRALEAIIFNPFDIGQFEESDLVAAIASKSQEDWLKKAQTVGKSKQWPVYQALARLWRNTMDKEKKSAA